MKFLPQRPFAVVMLLAALLANPAAARPVLVEMFTSQNCSSCPPADAYLLQLAKNPDILALSFNVTYWANPNWTDPYALTGATDRQAWYATLVNSENVFTPEAVIDGGVQLVGSDQRKIAAAIAAAKTAPAGDIPITIADAPNNMIHVTIGAGQGGATMWLFGYDALHTTTVGGGENGGATLTEANIVRSISNMGIWTGPITEFTISRPAGQHFAFILQLPTGAVLGAAAK